MKPTWLRENLSPKVCIICNRKFKPNSGIQKVCSEKCRSIWIKKYTNNYHKIKKRQKATCLTCGKEFLFNPSDSQGKYCSPTCFIASGKLRNKGRTRFRKGHSIRRKEWKPTEETKRKISESLKKAYLSGRHRIIRYWKRKRLSIEHRRHLSEARKGKSLPNPFHKGHKINPKGIHRSPQTEFKKGDPRIPIIARKGRLKQIFPKKATSIEVKMQRELRKRGVNFETNSTILNLCQPDIVIREKKIVVFCDGDYWHRLPSYVLRDKKQNKVLRANGWTVLRFWEHEINSDVSSCVDKILEVIK